MENPLDLAGLRFDNRFVDGLPADPQKMNLTRPVRGACYSFAQPTPVAAPEVVAVSEEALALLGLAPDVAKDPRFARVFGGNEMLPGMQPYAMAYGGHQFGHWAGQLGDGRAINLGEVALAGGQHLTLQLKGAGPTPYSRSADGRAVLRSSVREFLCSEAMFHLGVPTTRALSLVRTGDMVPRDMFYDGNERDEPGAVVCRVAPSFVRFGSFELFASRGEHDVLKQLADHTIRNCFPELVRGGEITKATYVDWYREVAERTAAMVVHWGRVGFVHGVMNTDNMSILGQTIDYGPYGWLEDYDPDWTPNTTDAGQRRYAFGQQARMAMWNVAQLGNALQPLVGEMEPLQAVVEHFGERYAQGWRNMMASKLGLGELRGEADLQLVQDLLELISSVETDMTIFFRELASMEFAQGVKGRGLLNRALYQPASQVPDDRERLDQWLVRYSARLAKDGVDDAQRSASMKRVNPKFVLRNYLSQLAIDKAESGDFTMVEELLEVLRRPYDEQPESSSFAEKRPDWARDRPGCSMLSCSS